MLWYHFVACNEFSTVYRGINDISDSDSDFFLDALSSTYSKFFYKSMTLWSYCIFTLEYFSLRVCVSPSVCLWGCSQINCFGHRFCWGFWLSKSYVYGQIKLSFTSLKSCFCIYFFVILLVQVSRRSRCSLKIDSQKQWTEIDLDIYLNKTV